VHLATVFWRFIAGRGEKTVTMGSARRSFGLVLNSHQPEEHTTMIIPSTTFDVSSHSGPPFHITTWALFLDAVAEKDMESLSRAF
jgi:hypothetical protein